MILFKRLFASLLTLFSVLLLTFFLLHVVPGGPFDQERNLPLEIEENLHKKYGLHQRGDDSFWVWIGKDLRSYTAFLMKGELGPSLKFRDRDVTDILKTAIPPSFELGIYALLISVVAGIACGIQAVKKPGGWMDHIILFWSPLFVSFPRFVAAVFLVFLFSFILKIFPPALWEGISYRVLPVITLSLAPLAYLATLTRSQLLGQMGQDFIKTARSKGLTDYRIIFKHALKNAAIPLLTVLGPLAAQLITGSFIVETMFAIPGLGRHFVTAITDRDYFLVMGITLVYSTFLIALNWLVDLGYLILDPRMRK